MDQSAIQALMVKVNRKEGFVRLSDLIDYLTRIRAECDSALRFRNCPERDADWYRGKTAIPTELLNALSEASHE